MFKRNLFYLGLFFGTVLIPGSQLISADSTSIGRALQNTEVSFRGDVGGRDFNRGVDRGFDRVDRGFDRGMDRGVYGVGFGANVDPYYYNDSYYSYPNTSVPNYNYSTENYNTNPFGY
jgi:hypothetical protein